MRSFVFTNLTVVVLSTLSLCPTGFADVTFRRSSTVHVIADPRTPLEQRLSGRLADYLAKVTGKPPKVADTLERVAAGEPAIVLVSGQVKSPIPLPTMDEWAESFVLLTGQAGGHDLVIAAGRTDRGLKRAVQRLIIESRQEQDGLVFPDMKRSERPWIPRREWTICPWTPNNVRGVFSNPQADRRMDITRYSNQQLADYVEMFDWFGYSGSQLMETCYSYSVLGSVEAFQGWQERVARALRENGQEVSLWLWAAQFSGFSWHDPEVLATTIASKDAFEDAATRRIFEKYYDQYARLSPLVDRVFGHFYDPGALADQEDVFKYMRLLEEKFKRLNPTIQMGIDFWAAGPDYMQQLIDRGFKDYLLLENGMPLVNPPGTMEKRHGQAREHGLELGVWGWYLTEYETDQMASMYVNCRMLQHAYRKIRQEGHEVHPISYWSEMEAHHLNNIYSMYVAAQLLWNPDRDPHDALGELVLGIWGPTNGPEVLTALRMIEDVRSGPTWETYWWTAPHYRIGTDRPEEDLQRARDAVASLSGMKTDAAFVPKFPLPFPPATFVELMMPHLKQIEAYAEFRIKMAAIRNAAQEKADPAALQKMFDEAFLPIPEYGTWVGTFGTPEMRAQDKLARGICKELNLTMREPAGLRYLEADRMFQVARNRYRNTASDAPLPLSSLNEFFWSPEKTADRLAKLIDDGVLEKVGDDRFRIR